MKTNTLYSKYVTTHYQYVAPATRASFRRRYYVWRSYLSAFLPDTKEGAILEVGCGVGHNLYALKELGFTNVSGIDYSEECVRICRKQGFSAQVVTGESEKQFYRAHKYTYDAVVLYDVLEHYAPKKAIILLSLIATSLRPNGCVIISLPNASHPFSNTLLFADITHKFIHTEASLSQLLRNAGFTRMRFLQMNSFASYDDHVMKRLLKTMLVPAISFIGEFFWRCIALSQGILLKQCRPTLLAVAQR